MLIFTTSVLPIRFFFLFFIANLLIVNKSAAQIHIAPQDRAILVDLYNNTSGSTWHTNTGWLSEHSNWEGIDIDEAGHVTYLNLSANQLKGYIPPSLGRLSKLQHLDLSSNQLSGTIPESLGNLSSLTTLNLGGCELVGSIPKSLGNLSNLESLNLGANRLTGSIPSSLGALTKLRSLNFGSGFIEKANRLTGRIPSSLGNLSMLIDLRLTLNELSGEIPSSFGRLTKLRVLDLRLNKLSGYIPFSLGNLSELESLDLSSNALSGPIPSSFAKLLELRWLNLNQNLLDGTIPLFFASFSKLNGLELGGNELTGKIPSEIGKISSLTSLVLSGNKLTGEIPSALGDLSNLSTLSLAFNELTGMIPETLGNLVKLYTLNLRNNRLRGNVPVTFQRLFKQGRGSLSLNDNLLSGKVPSFIQELPANSKIYLHNNRFTFDGIETLAQKKFNVLVYAPQAPIPVTVTPRSTGISLFSVSAGGNYKNNVYKWFVDGHLIATNLGDSTFVASTNSNCYVEILNTFALDLTLHSARVDVIDPFPAMVSDRGTISQEISHIDFTKRIKGAATDGVSKALIVAFSDVPIKFSLSNVKDGYLTSVMNQTEKRTELTIEPVTGKAVAIYTVPDGYGGSNVNGERKIGIEVSYADGDKLVEVPLSLVSPPVILVHGMWSSPDAWKSFEKYLKQRGFDNIELANYQAYNHQTFDPLNSESIPARNAIRRSIEEALATYKKKGILVSQVDVVGHSLGAQHTKSYAQDPTFRSVRVENYFKGDIHKLISIGSPHLGSGLGPILFQKKDVVIQFLPHIQVKLKELMKLSDMEIGSCHEDFNPIFKNTGKGFDNINSTRFFKVHAIVANWLSKGLPAFEAIDALLDILAQTSLNETLGDPFNDIIVGEYSQYGGLTNKKHFHHYQNTTHSPLTSAAPGETENRDIQTDVADLLLSDDVSLFAESFPSPRDIATPFDRKNKTEVAPANPSLPGTNQLKIVSPLRGRQIENHGKDSLDLQIEFRDDSKVSKALVFLSDGSWVKFPDKPPFRVKIPVAATISSGPLNIVAIAKGTDGIIYCDTLSVIVASAGQLLSIVSEPTLITLDSNYRESSIRVYGIFLNGLDTTHRNISSTSTGTAYLSKSNNSIAVIDEKGRVNARKAGRDTVIVTHDKFKDTIEVLVDHNLALAEKYENEIKFFVSNKKIDDLPFALNARTTSGDEVSFLLLSGPVELNDGIVTIKGVGSVKIKASAPGNAYFKAPRDVIISFVIEPRLVGRCCYQQIVFCNAAFTEKSCTRSGDSSGIWMGVGVCDSSYLECKFVESYVTNLKARFSQEMNSVDLLWTDTSNRNKLGYYIQRSRNGVTFKKIGYVKKGSMLGAYKFVDINPLGIGYYRLQWVSENVINYSQIVTAVTTNNEQLQFYPNPGKNTVRLFINQMQTSPGELLVYDAEGRLVERQKLNSTNNEFNVSALPRGVYLITVSQQGKRYSAKFLKE